MFKVMFFCEFLGSIYLCHFAGYLAGEAINDVTSSNLTAIFTYLSVFILCVYSSFWIIRYQVACVKMFFELVHRTHRVEQMLQKTQQQDWQAVEE